MFIDVRHLKNSKRHRRGMFLKRGIDQCVPQQHTTPMGLAVCLIPHFYKHFNPTGFENDVETRIQQ